MSIQSTKSQVQSIRSTKELANFISKGIDFEPITDLILKPLPQIRVKITRLVQDEGYHKRLQLNAVDEVIGEVPTDTEDETLAPDQSNVPKGMKRIEEEVFAQHQYAIILKLPTSLPEEHAAKLQVGDIVTYHGPSSRAFGLFKDSVLAPLYSISTKYTGDIDKLFRQLNHQ
jgi:hypothetical protein